MKRPLGIRLTNIFGRRDVKRAIDEMVMFSQDPTVLLTEEAQYRLFLKLRSDHRAMKKSNAQSRAHYAAQQKAKT